jgi:hypothetical protein
METWIASHFLNPAFVLAGTALVAAPIIIHLINRLRYRRVQFAAMEFLLQSQQRNRRRILIEQILLLLLRILIVLAIVALISRLVIDPSEMSLFQGARSHHVVLLDDSGSMREQIGEESAFESSIAVVRRLVSEGSRRPGTQKFTMLSLSNPDQPLFTQREVDENFLAELETRLEGLRCSHQSLSLQSGLEGARNVLLEDKATIRHLHVISDFREADWQEQQSIGRIVKELDSAGVTLNLVKTVGQRNQNLGITELTGHLQIASAGVPVRFSVTVQNFGDQVASRVGVAIFQDGQKLPLAVNFDKIEAGVEVQQEFDLTFDAPGRHQIELRLSPDPLTSDNARHLAVDVAPVNRVLIIEGNPASDEGEYLADALAADPGITGYSPQIDTVDFLRRRSLEGFQSVFMLNVADMPADALAPLEAFVRDGGGLAWFLGDEIRPAFYLGELYQEGKGLFPVRIGLIANQASTFADDSGPDTEFEDHSIFQVFQGQDNPFTALMRVNQFFPVAEDWERDDQRRGDNVRTLARLTNRQPLIFESKFGAGEVFICLTSCGPVWNNWARLPGYPPMMLDLDKHIAKKDRVLERRAVGEPIRLSLDPAEFLDEVEIVGPEQDGERTTRLKAAPTQSGSSDTSTAPTALRLTAAFRDTDAPGVYRVRLIDQSQTTVERWITFNVPTDESELELAENKLIHKQLGDVEVQIQEPGTFSWIAGREAGQEVRFWLLVILIVAAFCEQILAYRLSYHARTA